tara:strand:+ start:488 stop:1537 length:1050 start_codon:yes stop_codon:yes gene_type:complete
MKNLEYININDSLNEVETALARKGVLQEEQKNMIGGYLHPDSATLKYYHASRTLFYYFLNTERYPEVLPYAKKMALDCFSDAEHYMQEDHPESDFPEVCIFFPYDPDIFDQKVISHWQTMMKTVLDDWVKEGCPNKWYSHTREHLEDFLLQEAPFHLTDGAWLRGSNPVGTIDSVDAALISVYFDELGNGDVAMNHCNVYNENLKSIGIHMPQVYKRSFIEQRNLLDGSFVSPTFALAVSLFPRTFKPEIIGMTLWLELSSAALHAPQAKILEKYSLSSLFSKLHTAVDNPTCGHSYLAKEAVKDYLSEILKVEGKASMTEHWKRIWRGYTAYAITGGFKHEFEAKWNA